MSEQATEILTVNGSLTENAEYYIVETLRELKSLQEQEKKIKAGLVTAMQNHGVKSISTDDISITYIEPTDRITLDTKTLKEECPDIFEAYAKVTTAAASVRIKLK